MPVDGPYPDARWLHVDQRRNRQPLPRLYLRGDLRTRRRRYSISVTGNRSRRVSHPAKEEVMS